MPEKSVLQQIDDVYAKPPPQQNTMDKVLTGIGKAGRGIIDFGGNALNTVKSAFGMGDKTVPPKRSLAPGETPGNRALADMVGDKNKVYFDRTQVQEEMMNRQLTGGQ